MRDSPRLGGGRAAISISPTFAFRPMRCSETAATCLPEIEGVVDRAIAALGAEAVGIMRTMLDTTLEYTKVRQQFGRPLSANQVIRHRLADMSMQCEEARSIALRAALLADAEPVARGRAASGAKAKIGSCARFVAEQAVQLHGAMGVTDELDIGAYFKRLLAFDALFGGSAHHYRRHAALCGRATQIGRSAAMDLSFTPRARLRDGSPRLYRGKSYARNEARDRADAVGVLRSRYRHGLAKGAAREGLGRAGLAGGTWRPGLDGDAAMDLRGRMRCGRRAQCQLMGVKMVGPVIIGFGTPEQKNFYLPRILTGEDYWCQGYSEPGSGSDLASLKTRAVRDGDHYIVNGTKIWTTHAHHANRMFALVRTSDAPRQQDGISFLLIDMKSRASPFGRS